MTQTTTVLVTIRYPLTEMSCRTLRRAVEIVEQRADARLVVLHVNAYGRTVTRRELAESVRWEVGAVEVTYVVRRGFIFEEAVLEEASSHDDAVGVVGRGRRNRWHRTLRRLLGLDGDLVTFLREHSDARLDVVA